jgi:Kelch motif
MRWLPRASAVSLAAALALLALVAGCGGNGEPGNTVFQSRSDGWERAASMSQRRSYIAGARLGDAVYAAGGMVGETGRPLATFSRYDPARDDWTQLPQLPVATRAAAAAALDGTIYVAGGSTPDGNTAAVWAWDGARWRARAPLPRPLFNQAMVVVGGTLYALGGYADGRELRDVYRYEPAGDRWVLATRLPRPNHAFGAVDFRGELWTIGGRRGERVLREVWIWSPATGRWRRGPTLPRPMELLGATVSGDEIHAVWESTYQIWDASEGRWMQGPPLRVPRHGLQVFAVGDTLLAVGGCTTDLHDSQVVERRPLH